MSQAYRLEDGRLLADTFSVGTSLLDTYMAHLASGKPLMIPFRSHTPQTEATARSRFDLARGA